MNKKTFGVFSVALVCTTQMVPLSARESNGIVSEEVTNVGEQENEDLNDVLDLEEVVVTGQGAAIQKRRLSSNVQTLHAKDLQQHPAQRVDAVLQSALPNMRINLSGGQPGATSLMIARGLSSAFSNSTPVIYVDGVRVDNNNTSSALNNDLNGGNYTGAGYAGQTASNSSIADIPLENIERIEYVTGGAATTLYGSDAANGVIQIFTKKGGLGRMQTSITADLGSEVANSDFYYFRNTADLIHQAAFFQRYRLTADAATERGGWSLGASMQHSDGTIVGDANEHRNYSVRFGAHHEISRWMEYETSFGAALQEMRYARNGNEGLYGGLWTLECGAVTGQWWTDAEGQRHSFPADVDQIKGEAFDQLKQICLGGEGLSDHRERIRRFQMSHALVYRPVKGLTAKATLGIDYRHNNNKYTITNAWIEAAQQAASVPQSTMRNFDRDYLGLTFDASVQYNHRHDDLWSLVSTAGFQFFSTDDHQTSIFGKDLRDGSLTLDGAATTYGHEWLSRLHNEGLFLQENFGLLDRYYLDLGIRTDYNSGFGDNVGWQWYPKVGLSYLLSEEKMLADKEWLQTLRLFANYGVAGLYPPAFAYQRTVSFGSYQGGLAASFGQYGNQDLGPEKKHSFEAGLNARLFDRLVLGITYYNALTRDALFSVPLPPSVGEGSNLANVGRIRNEGMEFTLNADLYRAHDLTVSLNASLNTNHNRVLSTGGAAPFAIGGFGSSTAQSVVSEGRPVGYIRASRTTLQSDGSPLCEAYQDLGRTTPAAYGTMGLTVSYRQLNIHVTGDYQTGSYVHSYNRQFLFRKGLKDSRVPEELLIACGMAADGSNRAAIQKTQAWNFTNFFVYKADYAKIRNIGADYTFRQPVKGVTSVKVGFDVTNPFCFTSCPVDPEATVSTTFSQGAVATGGFNYATYSAPRQYVGSIAITF